MGSMLRPGIIGRNLLDKVGEHRRIRLQPLLRVLTREGVTPVSVGIADLERYYQARRSECLRRDPEGTWRDLAWAWNRCVRDVPGWPEATIALPSRRQTYIRPWTDYPTSLKQERRSPACLLGRDEPRGGRATSPSAPQHAETEGTAAALLCGRAGCQRL
jgi:hypothetical protein